LTSLRFRKPISRLIGEQRKKNILSFSRAFRLPPPRSQGSQSDGAPDNRQQHQFDAGICLDLCHCPDSRTVRFSNRSAGVFAPNWDFPVSVTSRDVFKPIAGPLSWSNWNFKCWFLWREENGSTWRKTLGVRREPTTNSTIIWHPARIEPGTHRWEASAFITAPSLLPIKPRDKGAGPSDVSWYPSFLMFRCSQSVLSLPSFYFSDSDSLSSLPV